MPVEDALNGEPIDVEHLGIVTETHIDHKGDIHQIEKPSESSYQYTSNSTNPVSSLMNRPITHRTESLLTPYRERSPIQPEDGQGYITHYSPAGFKHEVHKNREISESLKFKPISDERKEYRKFKRHSRDPSFDSEYLKMGVEVPKSKPRNGSKSRRNESRSRDSEFKTFSPSKRILSDNQFITHHIDNIHTKPPRKHVFPAS
jgi:hypothetical protein